MKIIFASKFYYRRGGLETYLFKVKELLESHGHQIIPFSTNYYGNYASEYSKYFTKYYDLSKMGRSGNAKENIRAALTMFHNKEAYNNMKRLIEKTNPDLVQGFGITKHLTYSIFKAANEMGVPTLMRLSDYAILCPNSSATDGTGRICTDFSCSRGDYSRIVKTKCIQDSRVASIIGKFEVKALLLIDVYKKYVDYFIAPSKFIRNIFIQHFKISPHRIIYHPIFNDAEDISLENSDDGFYLFAGRLSKEKGVATLLHGFANNKKSKLVIAGTGPEESNLKRYAEKANINAEFVGFKHYKDIQDLISRCRAVIIPSEWYENSPNIILEAYAQGKPVIGSRIGGIPELIEENKTGFLFAMGDAEELAKKIALIDEDTNLRYDLGRQALNLVKKKFSSVEHYKYLIKTYETATKKKVLLVNNFYYNRGGDCTYLFALKNMLEKRGHNVVIFSMHHPQNFDSEWSEYFVKYINYDEEVKNINLKSGMRVATRTIFFFKAKKMIEKLIREEKPDIAHLQNIHHHITPSILFSLRKYNIPVVWTLHDYQLICSNISFLAYGKICERCKKHKYYWPFIVKCKKGSFAASLMSSIEITMHSIMGINKIVNNFITPSNFLKTKFLEFGYDKKKIREVSHFIDVDTQKETALQSNYYLFLGRLTEEKGIKTLITAATKISSSKLKIVGDGPLLDEMIKYAKTIDKNNTIKFLGRKNREEVYDLLRNCLFLVIPSEWYENFPFSVMEAYACGKPVIGARIGGIPELIKNNETGLTFEMGNADDLLSKIQYMLNNPEETRRMGENARNIIKNELNAEKHYQKLINIYEEVDT